MSALREVLSASAPDLIGDVRSAMRLDLRAAHRTGKIDAVRDVPSLTAEIDKLNLSGSSRIRVFDRASYVMPSALILQNMKTWGRQRRGDAFEIIDRPRSQEWDQFAAEREIYARQATLPFRLHLYDTVAYVAIDFDDLRAGAFRTRDPGILADLDRLFTMAWRGARPMSGPSADRDVLEVVRLLISGLTDESAAQRLGVSLRTYRRRVAELMTTLGVDSRFAAGVEADRRGLVALAQASDLPLGETA